MAFREQPLDASPSFYDFSPLADEAIKGSIYVQLFLLCLRAKNIPRSREIFIQILLLLAQMPEDATSMHWMEKIFRYALSVKDIESESATSWSGGFAWKYYLSGTGCA